MIYSLLTLFAVYRISSSNRLLLQQNYIPMLPGGPQAQAPQAPQAQVPIDPLIPILPGGPQAQVPQVPIDPIIEPVVPVTPAIVPPGAPAPEYVPIPAAVSPQGPQQIPVDPTNPAQPIIPAYVLPPVAPPKLECKFSPPNPLSCAGSIQTIHNPPHFFELLCDGEYGCAGTTFNIDFGTDANQYMEGIKGFWFIGEGAASGAVININNQRPGDKIRIEEINCDKRGACANAQFIIGPNVEIDFGDFFCSQGACDGCVVKESIIDPGRSCWSFAEPI